MTKRFAKTTTEPETLSFELRCLRYLFQIPLNIMSGFFYLILCLFDLLGSLKIRHLALKLIITVRTIDGSCGVLVLGHLNHVLDLYL